MDKKYTQDQLKEIFTGLDNGLTKEQVSIYSNPDISKGRMAQIRLGLEAGLGNRVNLYSSIKFDVKQMKSIRRLLLVGLKDSHMKIITPEYSYKQILILGLALITGIDKDWALGFIKYEEACDEMFHIFSTSFYNNKLRFIPEALYYNFSNEFYAQSIKILLETGRRSLK